MARYRPYDYSQSVFIPLRLCDQLVAGTFEHALHHLIEERSLESSFASLYRNDAAGRCAYSPKLLLKVILFGYSRGITSSRGLERACRENVLFMALACQETPDHSTFAEFIARSRDQIQSFFSEVLLVCHEEGLLSGTHLALDGIKLPSNASREMSGTFEDLRKKKQKLEEKIAQKLCEHAQADAGDQAAQAQPADGGEAGDAPAADAHAASGKPPQTAEERRRAASLRRLEQRAARIEEFLAQNEPKQGVSGEIQSNVTDNGSACMHTSHGTFQGYNAQALVDSAHQIVLYAHASGDGQDYRQVEPVFAGAAHTLKEAKLCEAIVFEGTQLSADSSYHSLQNLQRCEELGLDAFIPDNHFRQRDGRFATQERHKERHRKEAGGPKKKGLFSIEDFRFQAEGESCVCPGGKVLDVDAGTVNIRGNVYRRYRAQEQDCINCPLRTKCLQKNARRRSVHVPVATVVQTQASEEAEAQAAAPGDGAAAETQTKSLTQRMREKIDRPESRQVYAKRLAIVEPVFANLRCNKGMDRFTYRGRAKVQTQWTLFCLVHNLEKLAHGSMRFTARQSGAGFSLN